MEQGIIPSISQATLCQHCRKNDFSILNESSLPSVANDCEQVWNAVLILILFRLNKPFPFRRISTINSLQTHKMNLHFSRCAIEWNERNEFKIWKMTWNLIKSKRRKVPVIYVNINFKVKLDENSISFTFAIRCYSFVLYMFLIRSLWIFYQTDFIEISFSYCGMMDIIYLQWPSLIFDTRASMLVEQ